MPVKDPMTPDKAGSGERIEDVPILALGSGVTLLGVVRTAGRAGIPLLAGPASGDLAGMSRWLPSRSRLPTMVPGTPLEDYLRGLEVDRAVLMPCSDDLVLEVAELPPTVRDRFPSFVPSAETLRALVDKGELLRTLERFEVPHPRTLLIDRPQDVGRISDDDLRGSFIKPRDSQRFMADYGVKGFRPAERDGFRTLLTELSDKGHQLMVQEYVPGPPSNHYFVDGFATAEGALATVFARQRLRMFPVDFGNSTYMASVPPEEARSAIDILRRMLGGLGYRGVFSAEFKRDNRDGVLRIIEVNARPWWYVEFAARAGVDVVTLAYRAALGLPIEPPDTYQVGRRLVFPYYDYQACMATSPSRWSGLRKAATGIGADQPVFTWTDPMPALRHWSERLPGIISRRLPFADRANRK
jgi:predicted ATP-grasp superfamily ATP-dependent carboligase